MKKARKRSEGITLIALIITIIVILILASVATYSGANIIKSSNVTKFITEMKIMQTEVNELYQKYKDGETIKVGSESYTGDEILTMRKNSTDKNYCTNIEDTSLPIYSQAEKVFKADESGITDKSGYIYFNKNLIRDLNIDGVEQEFFVNIKTRTVISCNGIKDEGKMNYTLQQISSGLYNVEYNDENTQNIPIIETIDIEGISNEKWRITISKINYNGNINKWKVKYQLEGKDYWNTSENLSFIVNKKGKYKIKIINDKIESEEKEIEVVGLPSNSQTTPYLPSNEFSIVEFDLNKGVTIKDKNNNTYVWIEVPKTTDVYKTSGLDINNFTTDVYEKIYNDLKTYTQDYKDNNSSDEWYSGCGIETKEKYDNLKNTMLKSIYQNGGFWIGQYETGIETSRSSENDELKTAIIQKGAYPYNYLKCSQAQEIATNIDSGSYTSSLMFGIQWDLVLKHIETRNGKKQEQIKNNSTEWGNYRNAKFDVKEGKYAIYDSTTQTLKEWKEITDTYTKKNEGEENIVLLSTGEVERNSILNIYDLAGNVYEWTLENMGEKGPCVSRGGNYGGTGEEQSVCVRTGNEIQKAYNYIGFRVTLY